MPPPTGYDARPGLSCEGSIMLSSRARSAVLTCLLLALPPAARAAGASPVFNARDHGAAGDGKTLDTAALNKAIGACAAAGGGQVLVPAGRYLTGTVRLK